MLTIRDATRSDVPTILAMIRELALYERAPDAAVATPELIEQHLFGDGLGKGPTAEGLIAEIDASPVGFAVYFHNFSTWLGRPGMYLEDLFVRPHARGAGVGKALLARVARIAESRGCRRLEWAVLDWNTPAIGFYERLGATPMSEWTTFRMTPPALNELARLDRATDA